MTDDPSQISQPWKNKLLPMFVTHFIMQSHRDVDTRRLSLSSALGPANSQGWCWTMDFHFESKDFNQ